MLDNKQYPHFFFSLGLLLICLFNYPILISIFDEWNSNGPYSHGFLGFAVALYGLWIKRLVFIELPTRPSLLGGGALIGSLLVLMLSSFASIQQLQQLSFFMVAISYFLAIYGWPAFKLYLCPFAMILLILPMWSVLQYPLREISTWVGYHAVNLLGIPIEREGYRLIAPGGMFDVEPACSGLGFFLVSALMAVCLAYFNRLPLRKGLQFLLIALSVSIVANWLRIIVIILVGNHTQMQHFIVNDHLTFGWFVFAGCLVPLIYIARTYFSGEVDVELEADKKVFFVGKVSDSKKNNTFFYMSLLFVLIALSFLQLFLPTRFDASYKLDLPAISQFKLVKGNLPSSPNWQPKFSGVSSESFYFYQSIAHPEINIQAYLGNYVYQAQGSEMIFVKNSFFNKNRWNKTIQPEFSGVLSAHAEYTFLTRGADRHRIIASFYIVDGQISVDKKITKFNEVKATILGRPGASVVAVMIDYSAIQEVEAFNVLNQFIEGVIRSPQFLLQQ